MTCTNKGLVAEFIKLFLSYCTYCTVCTDTVQLDMYMYLPTDNEGHVKGEDFPARCATQV